MKTQRYYGLGSGANKTRKNKIEVIPTEDRIIKNKREFTKSWKDGAILWAFEGIFAQYTRDYFTSVKEVEKLYTEYIHLVKSKNYILRATIDGNEYVIKNKKELVKSWKDGATLWTIEGMFAIFYREYYESDKELWDEISDLVKDSPLTLVAKFYE